jgi:hypothetical protein
MPRYSSRAQKLADPFLLLNQSGFRKGRSTAEPITTLKILAQHFYAKREPLFFAFLDLGAAFDTVPREALFAILPKYGLDDDLIKKIKLFYVNTKGVCCFEGGKSLPFPISTGVKRGCVLSPLFFAIYLDNILRDACQELYKGIQWQYLPSIIRAVLGIPHAQDADTPPEAFTHVHVL